VAAYLLLKEALREQENIMDNPIFEYGEHGKPFIVGHPELHFSLSHCKEAAICVISDKPVGVDVECIREFKDSLVSYTMNDEERTEIAASATPEATFIRFWTMKEATAKLVGTGITHDVKSLINPTKYKYTTVERQRYIYTVCEYL
jgi:4'-phosphopantetheinyl transferase